MPVQLILVIAALLVSLAVFTWLVKVLKATVTTALTIAIIILVLQIVFGIGPNQLWQQITQIPQALWQLVRGGK